MDCTHFSKENSSKIQEIEKLFFTINQKITLIKQFEKDNPVIIKRMFVKTEPIRYITPSIVKQ